MKATLIFQLIVTLLVVSCAFGQYPPSGYRPQGRPFILPARPAVNRGIGVGSNLLPQNQYGPPQNQYGPPTPPPNQYGAPDYRPQTTAAPPPDQYLPVDVRNNQEQRGLFNQRNYLRPNVQQNPFTINVNQQEEQNDQVYREQTYLPPNNFQQDLSNQADGFGVSSVNIQQQRSRTNENTNQNNFQQQDISNQAYGFGAGSVNNQQEQTRINDNANQNNFQQQDISNQAYGFGAGSVNSQQGRTRANDNVNQNLGQNPSVDRKYLAPAGNNFQRQPQQGTNFKQTQAVAKQLYQSPNEETNNNEDQDEDQALSVNDNNPRTNFGIASQNYLPPTTTERRKSAEPTTKRPEVGNFHNFNFVFIL